MAAKVDENFSEALSRVQAILRSVTVATTMYPGQFLDPNETQQLGLQALETLGADTSGTAQLNADAPVSSDQTPEWVSTDSLLRGLQQVIADNAPAVGVRRGEMDAVSLQTQFLLDLQRRVAEKSLTRVERVVRAAHRRVLMSAPAGPLSSLKKRVERSIASSGS